MLKGNFNKFAVVLVAALGASACAAPKGYIRADTSYNPAPPSEIIDGYCMDSKDEKVNRIAYKAHKSDFNGGGYKGGKFVNGDYINGKVDQTNCGTKNHEPAEISLPADISVANLEWRLKNGKEWEPFRDTEKRQWEWKQMGVNFSWCRHLEQWLSQVHSNNKNSKYTDNEGTGTYNFKGKSRKLISIDYYSSSCNIFDEAKVRYPTLVKQLENAYGLNDVHLDHNHDGMSNSEYRRRQAPPQEHKNSPSSAWQSAQDRRTASIKSDCEKSGKQVIHNLNTGKISCSNSRQVQYTF